VLSGYEQVLGERDRSRGCGLVGTRHGSIEPRRTPIRGFHAIGGFGDPTPVRKPSDAGGEKEGTGAPPAPIPSAAEPPIALR
jgi:hypothetical protein